METSVILLVLAASGLHATWNFAARRVKGELVVFWVSFLLAGAAFAPAAILWALWDEEGGGGLFSWQHVAATSLLHAVYFCLVAKAYEKGEISLVYPVARGTGVAGTAVIAMCLGIEEVSPQAWAGIAGVCAGAMLLGTDRFVLQNRLHALRAALLVGASIAGYSVVDKLGVGRSHPASYICGMFLGGAALMTPYVLLHCKGRIVTTCRTHWKYVLGIGPAALVSYVTILFAFRVGHVSHIVAFREVSVAFGAILGFVFLRERFTGRKALGVAAIVAGLIVIAVV